MKISHFDCSKKVFVIAEAGVNHEGSLQTALELVTAAKEARADAVKFQTYLPEEYIAASEEERFARASRFALSFKDFKTLSAHAKKTGIIFFSTPLDNASVDALKSLQPIYKISSGDMNFEPLIRYIAAQKKPIILSTGTASLAEIRQSLKWIQKETSAAFVKSNVSLLHCVAAYPAPAESVNLNCITLLKNEFGLTTGYSDHTPGIEVPPLAVAAGARIIEKHFTLSRENRIFRDHFISLEPQEFLEMVEKIRRVELLLGQGKKEMLAAEKENAPNMRRGIAVKNTLAAGKQITGNDLLFVRPQRDFKYDEARQVIGKKVRKEIKKGHLVAKGDIR